MSAEAADPQFDALLAYLREHRGFDFTGYKLATLERRFRRRMQDVKIEGFADYMDYLEVHPEEFAFLFNTILINVTSFFRDPETWKFLAANVIPRIIAERKPGEPIRVMSAGCASGEEAFTIAMLLSEALGEEAFRQRVKVYATDLDEEALAQARQASYGPKAIEAVPAALREKYFEQAGGIFRFRGDLRRAVIFGRHDLTRDAPISRLDLLLCRNTLMYFNAAAQRRILQRFHYALREGGFLFVGKAEMLLALGALGALGSKFATVDLKHRIFSRIPGPAIRERAVAEPAEAPATEASAERESLLLWKRTIQIAPDALFVVDAAGFLLVANEKARALFGLSLRDTGRPFRDLEISYRPMELRSVLDQAYLEARAITVPRVERHLPNGQSQFLDVVVTPIRDSAATWLGACLSFQERTAFYVAQQQLDHTKQELEAAYEDLQSTNEELQTTNEEVQSTVEELQTTNEELQATNEETEAMNKELQSTNADLHAAAAQRDALTQEARRNSGFLQSILTSVSVGVIVVDADLIVRLWNGQAEEIWGLRADEALGQRLASLDIGLPVAQLADHVRAFLSGKAEVSGEVIAATNRRGKSIHCRITCTLRLDDAGARQGVVLVMEEARP